MPGTVVSSNSFIKRLFFFFYIVLNTISQENRGLKADDERNRSEITLDLMSFQPTTNTIYHSIYLKTQYSFQLRMNQRKCL